MIELRNIMLSYGTRPILDHLDATFHPGRITAVMGPNGCGKTTLLRLTAGLLSPTSGQVLIEGKPVQSYTARDLARHVAFVRQHTQTDLDFSAFEIVLMGRNPYQRHLQNESRQDWDIVEEAMRQTGTWQLRFAKPSQMSGGELQRVMIARALAQRTPVLLLDEPVASLDIAYQIEVMHLLREAQSRKTILLVIHDLNLALHFCDDVLLLHNGRALYHGDIAHGLTPDHIRTVYGVEATVADRHVAFNY